MRIPKLFKFFSFYNLIKIFDDWDFLYEFISASENSFKEGD